VNGLEITLPVLAGGQRVIPGAFAEHGNDEGDPAVTIGDSDVQTRIRADLPFEGEVAAGADNRPAPDDTRGSASESAEYSPTAQETLGRRLTLRGDGPNSPDVDIDFAGDSETA
jgi:hypothetical protein